MDVKCETTNCIYVSAGKPIHYDDLDAPKKAPVVATYEEAIGNIVPRKKKKKRAS
jgi:hypothetical protein